MKEKQIAIPALAMRGLVLFEGLSLHFDVARKKSIMALGEAMSRDRNIFLVAQKDITTENPGGKDVYSYGVIANIKQMLKPQDGIVRVFVEGLKRAKIVEILDEKPFLNFMVTPEPLKPITKMQVEEITALMRVVKTVFEQYSLVVPKMSREIVLDALAQEDPNDLFEAIVFNIMLKYEERQQLLEAKNIYIRLKVLAEILSQETEILAYERDIYEQVRIQMDKNQREYYLREQMRVISNQLGEGENPQEEATEYMDEISLIGNISDESRDKLYKEAARLYKMPPSSQEANVIRGYLETCLDMPWDNTTKDNLDVVKAQKILEKDHYGLETVKERILEILAVRQLAPEIKGQIICLVGPPGVGKTSIAKSIAKTMNRAYVRLSLGGVRDESDIRGHRKTYVGAMPGRIINAIKQAKTRNPLILLDEIDKMGNDFRGDPSSAMLEVLDSEQNYAFRDHYMEIPFDLSEVLFLTTANDLSTVPAPLLDRMEVIELSSYTREEKYNIAKKHLVTKQVKRHGLTGKDISFTADGLYVLIDRYTREAGVRKLERAIANVCRKVAKLKVMDDFKKVNVNDASLLKLLGPKKYRVEKIEKFDTVGSVTGLAWTSVGGETMNIEVLTMNGTGKVEMTGSLGKVMTESAKIAVSIVRSLADKYDILADFYKEYDIHIHAPEGSVPKDGPSAGVTMVTALVSELANMQVRHDVAMTGEVSLRGKVMPIGGLKEKTIAAYRAGIKTVIIPYDNKPDIDKCADTVKENIKFIPVKNIQDVLDIALIPKKKIEDIDKLIIPDDTYDELIKKVPN